MSSIPSVTPGLTGALDLAKAATAAGKLGTKAPSDHPTPLDKATRFAALAAMVQGTTGGMLYGIGKYFPTVAKSYPHPITVAQTLKVSMGVIPSAITLTAGIQSDDKFAMALGGAGLATSTGGFRYMEHMASQSASNLFKVAPGWAKVAIAGTSILYGMNQIMGNITNPRKAGSPE